MSEIEYTLDASPDSLVAALAAIDGMEEAQEVQSSPETGAETPETPGADSTDNPGDGAESGDAGSSAAGAESADGVLQESTLPTAAERFSEVSDFGTGIEAAFTRRAEETILPRMNEEYANFIRHIQAAPRDLIGKELPINGDPANMSKIRDEESAVAWQREHQQLLEQTFQELREDYMREHSTERVAVNNALELFSANPDLIPGTTDFNKDLAEGVMKYASKFIVKDENGRAIGFTVSVNNLISYARQELQKRASTSAAPAPVVPEDPPQVGVGTRQGATSASDDAAELRAILAKTIGG